MKFPLLALPIVCLLSVPALAADSAADPSISSPTAGTELPLTGGLDYRIGTVSGATAYECAITQGNAKWKETVSGGSTGCSADHRTVVQKKFKPGRATFGVRAKVNGKWTAPASIVVKLVTAPTPPPPAPSSPPASGSGASSGGGAPSTWDGTYHASNQRPSAEFEAAHPSALRCPASSSMVGNVDIENGAVSFVIYLDPGKAAPNRMPAGARQDVTATLANGKITGTFPFRQETLDVLASPTAGYNGVLAGQTGLTITGTAVNEQGRKLKLTVSSGSNTCSFEATAR